MGPVAEKVLAAIVIRYIDRMNDVSPECGDPAERILDEFRRDVNEALAVEWGGCFDQP